MSIRKNTQCQDITISEWFGVVKLDLWLFLCPLHVRNQVLRLGDRSTLSSYLSS